jgi:FxsC-like protein
LRSRLGVQAGIFFDIKRIQATTDWESTRWEAISTSRVFLPILSPNYLNSEFCGKEFELFLARTRRAPGRSPGFVPLVWVPLLRQMPRVLRDFQLSDERMPKEYSERGMRTLARMRRRQEYEIVIANIAQHIFAAGHSWPLPPLPDRPRFDQIPNAFGEDTVATVTINVVYFTGTESEMRKVRPNPDVYGPMSWSWKPWGRSTIGSIVQEVLLKWRYWEVKASGIAAFLERASSDTILIVAVDPWVLQLPQYREWAEILDSTSVRFGSLIVVRDDRRDSREARETLDLSIRNSFSQWNQSAGRLAVGTVESEADLRLRAEQIAESFAADLISSRAARRKAGSRPVPKLK